MSFRPVVVNVGTVSTAEGSAVIRIGKTAVVCGIKAVSCKFNTNLYNYLLQ